MKFSTPTTMYPILDEFCECGRMIGFTQRRLEKYIEENLKKYENEDDQFFLDMISSIDRPDGDKVDRKHALLCKWMNENNITKMCCRVKYCRPIFYLVKDITSEGLVDLTTKGNRSLYKNNITESSESLGWYMHGSADGKLQTHSGNIEFDPSIYDKQVRKRTGLSNEAKMIQVYPTMKEEFPSIIPASPDSKAH